LEILLSRRRPPRISHPPRPCDHVVRVGERAVELVPLAAQGKVHVVPLAVFRKLRISGAAPRGPRPGGLCGSRRLRSRPSTRRPEPRSSLPRILHDRGCGHRPRGSSGRGGAAGRRAPPCPQGYAGGCGCQCEDQGCPDLGGGGVHRGAKFGLSGRRKERIFLPLRDCRLHAPPQPIPLQWRDPPGARGIRRPPSPWVLRCVEGAPPSRS